MRTCVRRTITKSIAKVQEERNQPMENFLEKNDKKWGSNHQQRWTNKNTTKHLVWLMQYKLSLSFQKKPDFCQAALLPGYMAVIFVDSKSLKPLDRHS